jgi:CBS domain-containing protein
MQIKEVMNDAIVIDHDVNLKQAAQIMSERNIGSLIVLKKDSIIGIITEQDILKNISSLNRRVSEVMSKNVVTIEVDGSLEEAALIMTEKKIRRLPVTKKGSLVGMITTTDIVANSDLLDEDFLFD